MNLKTSNDKQLLNVKIKYIIFFRKKHDDFVITAGKNSNKCSHIVQTVYIEAEALLSELQLFFLVCTFIKDYMMINKVEFCAS